MSSWRQQAVIDAPVDVVWGLVGDPQSYPEWASNVLEVTGVATIEEGATFSQETSSPFGKAKTDFVIDELDDLRKIRLRCLKSGYYSEWSLTAARGETFADIEIGMEPTRLPFRAYDAVIGKRTYRQVLEQTLDGLRESVARRGGGG